MCGVGLFRWSDHRMFFNSIELTPVSAATYVQRNLEEMSGWLVVVERFTPDQRVRTFQPDALEAIGMIKFIVKTSNRLNHIFILQGRAEAKKVAGTKDLKKLGWYKQTKDGHANDAALHILLALLTYYPQDYIALMDELQSL
jgi:hypothetical protein